MGEYDLSEVLTEFALTLVTDFPINKILDHLVTRIVDVLPVTAAGVTLIDPGKDPRYIAASNDAALRFEKLQSELSEGPCMESFESGRPVAVPDLENDDTFPTFAPAASDVGLAAVFAFPLYHGARRFGALDLYRSTPGPMDAGAMEAAQTLANVVSVYLINAQAREGAAARTAEMHHASTHDALTGLPNMLLLRQRIDQAARRARRTLAPAAVLFIDLDDFKRVNDTHGHLVGDHVLRAVADRLEKLIRDGDTLARIYGDEFVLLCEDLSDREDVDVLVRRIQDTFETPFAIGDKSLSVSASVGIAFAGPGAEVTEDLVTEADKAMYDVKRRGGGGRVTDLREGHARA